MSPDYLTNLHPPGYPGANAVGVPRQFGVGGLLALLTLFAVLFAMLKLVSPVFAPAWDPARIHPEPFAIVLILFLGVVAGQVLLFGGRRPREASAIVGVVIFPLEVLGVVIYRAVASGGGVGFRAAFWVPAVLLLLLSIPAGAALGYIAGVMTAGIFLLFGRWLGAPGAEEPPEVELRPFAAADLDRLPPWIETVARERWWLPKLARPLDRGRFEFRLAEAAAPDPAVLMFKAVCRQTGRMVGYAELVHLDRLARTARICLPMIAPDASPPEQWSAALLRAVLKTAFEGLALSRVEAVVAAWDLGARECYWRLGLKQQGTFRHTVESEGAYVNLVVLGILADEWRRMYATEDIGRRGLL